MANLSNWYESKSLVVQALVDLVCQRTSFVLKEPEIDRFLLMLADMVLNRKTSLQIHSSVSTRVMRMASCSSLSKTGVLLLRDVFLSSY